MKIKFTADAKKYITVAEMPHVRRIIDEMREDDSLKDYAEMAARVASGNNDSFEILKAEKWEEVV